MTREEAIEILKDLWRTKHSTYLEADIREALEMAIKSLSQELCEDTISRKDAIKALQNVVCISAAIKSRMVGAIKELPSVTQKSGKWIITYPHGKHNPIYECPCCHASNSSVFKNYCPNCGAKMESEERE